MDTLMCRVCGHNVPAQNREIHEARCVRVQQNQQPAPLAISVPPDTSCSSEPNVIDFTWACPRCTYVNDCEESSCAMCGVGISINNENMEAVEDMDIAASDESFSPDEPNCTVDGISEQMGGGNEATWSCAACTFLNSRSNDSCAMCLVPRPPAPSYRETLVPENTAFYMAQPMREVPTARQVPEHFEQSLAGSGLLLGAGLGAGLAWLNDSDVAGGALAGAGLGAIGELMMREMAEQARLRAAQREAMLSGVFGGRNQGSFARRQQFPTESNNSGAISSSAVDRMMQEVILAHMLGGPMGTARLRRSGSGLEATAGLDIDGMPFEELLERFPQPARGVDAGVLDALPVRTYVPPPSSKSGCSSSYSASATTSSAGGSAPAKQSCSICLEDYAAGDQVKTLPCLHCFHSACVDNWLRQQNTCPVCKHAIENGN